MSLKSFIILKSHFVIVVLEDLTHSCFNRIVIQNQCESWIERSMVVIIFQLIVVKVENKRAKLTFKVLNSLQKRSFKFTAERRGGEIWATIIFEKQVAAIVDVCVCVCVCVRVWGWVRVIKVRVFLSKVLFVRKMIASSYFSVCARTSISNKVFTLNVWCWCWSWHWWFKGG